MMEVLVLLLSIVVLVQQIRIDKLKKDVDKLEFVCGTLIGKVILGKDITAKVEVIEKWVKKKNIMI